MGFRPRRVIVAVDAAADPDADGDVGAALVDAACDVVGGVDDAVIRLVCVDGSRVVGVDPNALALEADSDAAVAERLELLAARVQQRGPRVEVALLSPVDGVGEAIAHDAATADADLVVCWSHGRRGLSRVFLGSVAARIAHVATTPVLILR